MAKSDMDKSKKLLTRREFLVGGGAVLAVAALVACSNKVAPVTSGTSSSTMTSTTTGSASIPKYGGTLIGIWDAGTSPALGYPPEYGPAASNFGQPFFEALLRGDSKGGVYPWLAESFKVADDLTSITFKLRKGVKFHDGSDFNAQAVKWNFEQQMAAKKVPHWTSVDIIDNYTVRVNFDQWRNNLLSDFADNLNCAGWMISPTAFSSKGIDWVRMNPVGTGPFKFVNYVTDVGLKTVRNPDYWGKDTNGNQLPYLDTLELRIVADSSTRSMVMQTGGADMVFAYPDKLSKDYLAMGLEIKMTMNGTRHLVPDSANSDSPWANLKVREAAEYAIDREGIAKGLSYGFWDAAYQLPGHDSPAYDPNFKLSRKYDPEKAKQLLDEAGFNGNPRFKTTIICFTGNYNKDVVAAMQANLADVGIQAVIEVPDIPKFMSYLMGGWHNSVLFAPSLDWADVNSGLAEFDPANPMYKSWLRSPEFLNAYQNAMASRDLDINLTRAVINVMANEASASPIHDTGGGWAFKPYVKNAGWGTRGHYSFLNYEGIWLNK